MKALIPETPLQQIDTVLGFLKQYLWRTPLRLLNKILVKSRHGISALAQRYGRSFNPQTASAISKNHLQFAEYIALQHWFEVRMHRQYTTYLLSPP